MWIDSVITSAQAIASMDVQGKESVTLAIATATSVMLERIAPSSTASQIVMVMESVWVLVYVTVMMDSPEPIAQRLNMLRIVQSVQILLHIHIV